MKIWCIAAIIVCAAAYAFPDGYDPESARGVNGGGANTGTLTGRVQIYGSEPHTFVGIIDTKGVEYAVYAPENDREIRDLQGRLIEFTVVFLKDTQTYGSLFLKGGAVQPIKWRIIE